MKRMLMTSWLAMVVAFSAAVARGEAAIPENLFTADADTVKQVVETMIGRLGADEFSARESAQRTLEKIGRRLKSADEWDGTDTKALGRYHDCFVVPLVAAADSDDFEVRARIKEIRNQMRIVHPIGGDADGWLIYQLLDDTRYIPDPHSKVSAVREVLQATGNVRYLDFFRRDLASVVFEASIVKLGQDDPTATAQWILSPDFEDKNWLPRPSRGMAVAALVRTWALDDFDAAFRWCVELNNYDEPNWPPDAERIERDTRRNKSFIYAENRFFLTAFRELVRYWPDNRPIHQAVELLSLHPQDPESSGADQTCLRIAEHWAKNDPVATIRWAQTLPWQTAKDEILRRIFRNLGRSDMNAATKWLQEIGEPRDRERAAEWLARAFLSQNQPLSETLTENLSEDFRAYLGEEDNLAKVISIEKMRDAHAARKRWRESPHAVLTLSVGDYENGLKDREAEKTLESIWNYKNPSAAASAINADPPRHVAWPMWASLLGYMWSHRDMNAAITFAARLNPSEARTLMIAEILRTKLDIDTSWD